VRVYVRMCMRACAHGSLARARKSSSFSVRVFERARVKYFHPVQSDLQAKARCPLSRGVLSSSATHSVSKALSGSEGPLRDTLRVYRENLIIESRCVEE